jgi:dihydrofolate synthase/folylpolyglutamate synthase
MRPSSRSHPPFSFRAAEAFLRGFTNYEKQPSFTLRRGDLGRVALLLSRLGNPQRGIPALRVTGSKGKGTTCVILEALLTHAGLKVGTYLSPHLECVTERIRVHARPISRQRFAAALGAIAPRIAHLPAPPTYFEILTALAWHVFKDDGVDVAIIEAGIGGKFDATACCDTALGIVTSIEKEHTEILGRTEAAITRQKIGIGRRGTPLLVGPLKPHLRKVAATEARALGARLMPWHASIALEFEHSAAHVRLHGELPRTEARFAAPDRPFAVNAALALGACATFLGTAPDDAGRVIARTRMPGRKELFEGAPPVLIDVAHTRESLRALGEAVESWFPRRRMAVVFALARDKDAPRLLPLVEGFADALVFVCADPVRGASAEDLRRLSGHARTSIADSTAQALEKARDAAGSRGVVVVCGSFVVAGQARTLVRRQARTRRT